MLSGGGARGAAHIGLLQVLEQHRIPVDLIAATSMGALVGGLYASGLTPAALDSVVTGLDWADAFNDKIRRADRTFCRKRDDDLLLMKKQPGLRGKSLLLPPSMLDTHRIDLLLRRLSLPVVAAHNFDELGIPFRAVAADLVTGEPVVLDHGDLAQAMRASMSIPGAFAPLTIDGRLLVDGGIADNLPIDVARAMGADVLIVVDVAPPPKRREDLNSLPAITFQLTILASEQNRRRQIDALGRRDVYIAPELGTMTMASFDRAANAIEMGRQAAEAAMPALEPLALSPAEYDAHRAARAARIPAPDSLLIADVRIENQTRVSDAVFANRLDVQPGRLDVEHLEHGLDRLCGLELFESIGYDIQPGPTGDTLTVTPTPRTWGPNYLQTGIAIFDDYQHPSFNLALAYTRMAVNPLNGEWSTGVQFGTESGGWFRFHQPLEPRLHWFVDVQPSLISWPIPIFDGDGHKLSEYRVFQYGAAVAGGREIGEWGEVRAGVLRQGGTLQLSVGDPEPSSAIDTGELFVRAYADELDAVAFPRRGFLVRARASAGIEALGSAASYQQLSGDGFIVQSHRDLTVQLGGIIGITADSDAPIESQFRLGGLGRLSGLEQDERIGQQAALVRGMVYRRMSDIYPMYLGLSAEYGNTFETRADLGFDNAIAAAALFLGAETPFGPAVVGYGRADSGRYNFYLTLNRIIGGPRPSFRLR